MEAETPKYISHKMALVKQKCIINQELNYDKSNLDAYFPKWL